jgi:hypothetical protein
MFLSIDGALGLPHRGLGPREFRLRLAALRLQVVPPKPDQEVAALDPVADIGQRTNPLSREGASGKGARSWLSQ